MSNTSSQLQKVKSLRAPKSLTIDQVNEKINKELCMKTIDDLKDKNLVGEYLKTKSVQTRIETLEQILINSTDDEALRQKIIDNYIIELIPPGAKGIIRGMRFNIIIQDTINAMKLDPERFTVVYNTMHVKHVTTETPNWYIYEKATEKILIGMNQMDIWTGGFQHGRGIQYIKKIKPSETVKYVCVICTKKEFKSKNNKTFDLFETGFLNGTLTYLGGLNSIIFDFFKINTGDIPC